MLKAAIKSTPSKIPFGSAALAFGNVDSATTNAKAEARKSVTMAVNVRVTVIPQPPRQPLRLLASLLLCSLLQVRKTNFNEFRYKSCVLGFEPKYRCPLEQCESPNSSYFTNGELPSFYGSANYSDINDRCKIPEIIR